MYGRRDLVDAHLFLRGRLSAAVLRSDPDAPDRPLRRTATGMAIGLAVAAGAVVVVVVLNIFLFTTNDSWRNQAGALLVDKSTGSRYLLIDDTLHPVMNLASAALLVGGRPAVIQVSSEDLASVPRGEAVGREGLPDELPSPQATSPVWAACATGDGTALAIGGAPRVTPVGDDEGVLVRADDRLTLIWQGTRSDLAGPWAARALGFEPSAAVPVDDAWLDTIPGGRDIDLSELTLGGEGPAIAGAPTTLGQLVEADGDGSRYVVTAQGLMPVTETVAALLSAEQEHQLPEPRTITTRDLVATSVTKAAAWQSELPSTPPTAVGADLTPCSVWDDGTTTIATVAASSKAGGASAASATASSSSADSGSTDAAGAVRVAPGAGLLASTAAAPGVRGAGLYLVADDGTKYPVADAATASALGLDASSSPAVPAALLALLPTGPTIAK
ncbi:type VII secretion protein EccB [Schumannella luteola]|uniref:Type VII secretion protein EccB n=1 Tax=Schumannella luteola TaxID=472059 RepID=A0A852Y6L4_9MICO|nr:type VII secretion protein EccB [Schumannella luteola]NYG97943.1 type VII secretion protein EccB [Schumannella luteola]TPX03077.1 type VII secretion protein EccB [Schumannella luteola]